MKVKEKLFELMNDEETLVTVGNVYIPFLGKTIAINSESPLSISEENPVYETELKVLKNVRQDQEDGAEYRIEDVKATINFDDMTIKGSFTKVWEGGFVEKRVFYYTIESMQVDKTENGLIAKITINAK